MHDRKIHCPSCHGVGKLSDGSTDCPRCSGWGEIDALARIEQLSAALGDLLKEYTAERDSLYDGYTNSVGEYDHEDDERAVREMDAVIDKARAVASAPETPVCKRCNGTGEQQADHPGQCGRIQCRLCHGAGKAALTDKARAVASEKRDTGKEDGHV